MAPTPARLHRRTSLLALVLAALMTSMLVPYPVSAATHGSARGSVYAPDGTSPAADVEVSFLDVESGAATGPFTTTAAGEYVGEVPPGDYIVRLSDPLGRYRTSLLGGSDVATAAVVHVEAGLVVGVDDVTVEGLTGTLVGQVVDDTAASGAGEEAGIAGVTVEVFEAGLGDLVAVATTDPDGRYAVDVPVGRHLVRYEDPTRAHLPAFSEGQPTASTAPVHQVAADQVTFVGNDILTPSTGRIMADVRADATGDALTGIDITLYDGTGTPVAAAVSGESPVEFPDLPAGDYLARFVDPTGTHAAAFSGGVQRVSDADLVTLAPGATQFLSADLLPATTPTPTETPGTLTVRVTRDAEEAPVPDADVTVFAARTLATVGSGTTAADGSVAFVLPAGDYVTRVEDPTGAVDPSFSGGSPTISGASPVVLPDGGAQHDVHHLVEPVLAPGTLAGVVTHTQGSPSPLVGGGPAAGAQVVVVDLDAMIEVADLTTDGRGEFSTPLATGDYLVYSWVPDPIDPGLRRIDIRRATVEPAATSSVDLVLSCCDGSDDDGVTTTITRTLPASGINVAAFDLQSGTVRARRVASDGRVTFDLPTYGRYVLWAVDPLGRYHCSWDDFVHDRSCRTTPPVVEYPAYGPVLQPIAMQPTLVPASSQTISGTVMTSGGTALNEPVAGAQVAVLDNATGEIVNYAVTDGAGQYMTAAPTGSSYLVRFSDPDGAWRGFWAGAELATDAAAVAVTTGTDATGIDFFVETYGDPVPGPAVVDVELTFRDTFAPAHGVEVDVLDATSLAVLATTTVDGEGRAWVEVDAPADVVVRYRDPFARAATQFSGGQAIETAHVHGLSPGSFSLHESIVRDVAAVTGTVDARTTDDFEFPLAGAVIEVVDTTTLSPVAATTSDADGTFALDVPTPGPYLLRYRAEGFTSVLSDLAGGAVDLSAPGDLLEPGLPRQAEGHLTSIDGRLHGDVRDDVSNTGISGVEVEVWDPRTFTHIDTTTSGADGVFSVDLPGGEYLVRVADPLGRFAPAWYEAVDASVRSPGVRPVAVPAAARAELTIERQVNVPPSVIVTGVADGSTYEHGSVPLAGCSWSDHEDGSGTIGAVLSDIDGPRAAHGLGARTATCSFTDAGGSTASATATYDIVDTAAPVLTLPTPSPVEATGPDGAVVEFIATAVDSVDGAVAPTCQPSSGALLGLGTTVVTCDASDLEGNATSGTFDVLVHDTTRPVLTLPSGPVASATSAAGAVVEYTATAVDLVSGSVTVTCAPASDTTFPLGSTTVMCGASDAAGNDSGGAFTVTVQDDDVPVVTVPAPITTEATGPAGAVVDYAASATDAVDGPLVADCDPDSGATFGIGATDVTCTAEDAAGNAGSNGFAVSVVDTTAPVISAPASVEVEATSNLGAAVTFAVQADDLVDGAVGAACDWASGATFPLGTTSVTCTAIDTAGNDSESSFPVVVADTTAPAVTAPDDLMVEATAADGAPVTYVGQSAIDLVDGEVAVSCDPPSGSTLALGTTTVTCWGTDASLNEGSASFQVTVLDTTSPTLTLPGNAVVPAVDAAGAPFIYSASATDAVSGPSQPTCTPSSGATFPLGTTVVDCIATDDAGNGAAGSFSVTVQDQSAPIVEDLANRTVEATGPDGAAVGWGEVTAVDGVDGAIAAECTPPSGTMFGLGVTTVTCIALDQAGNEGANAFDVTVQDTTAPVVSTPDDIEVVATSGSGAVVDYGDAGAVDLVDGVLAPTCSHATGTVFALGVTTVTCTATDAAGNSGQRSFTVTVGVEWGEVSAPIATDGTSVFRRGQTVPVKFSLSGESSAIGDLTARLYVRKVTNDVVGDEEEASSTSRADAGNEFRYDEATEQYVFNLGTRALSTGTWQLRIDLGDGTLRTVRVGLR